MKKFSFLILAGLVIVLTGSTLSAAQAQESLDSMLRPYLAKYELPSLAAAVAKEGKIVCAGAVGTRRYGENIPVTIHDRYHLGSDTKAMTAVMVAMLVDQGKLRWNTPMGEIFPELAASMDPAFKGITVEQLLSQTSGMPSDNTSKESEAYTRFMIDEVSYPQGNLDEIRYWLVGKWCGLPVPSKPGEKFEYSNLNYIIAGAIVEHIEKKSWDELIIEKVFNPLGLRNTGLGIQSSLGRVDAPLGHAVVEGKIKCFLAGPRADNPVVVGPAGIANMSVLDFVTWAGWNAGEGKRGPHLVRPETLRKLHAPAVAIPAPKDAPLGTATVGKYAFGWGVVAVPWAAHPLLFHGGSNGLNFAEICVDTEKDLGIVILTNMGGKNADAAVKEIQKELYRKYGGK
ncbi:MAG: serine hydrolase domain-containing protein [Candidatus Eremiobacteraeota bacterium]|nr:serine hydrolase domain-containing protein [Candidatus Eremiobacteraeota bacterium]